MGPCRVVGKARHIRTSNIPYSAIGAMNVATCFIRSPALEAKSATGSTCLAHLRNNACSESVESEERVSGSSMLWTEALAVGMRRPVASPASVGLCSGGGRGGSSLSCYIARGCPSEGNNAPGGAVGAV
ncbi:hypothetical protein B296_00002119 [Ensete ventricosum]|uniref:Uncharacterized protein n=1 Tax=Ensete ventricosum TaxID=4639 RepID=A0A427ABN3_ENSVE|nr:hypothetical protein B296_00002119 [Ensete ventricosum]